MTLTVSRLSEDLSSYTSVVTEVLDLQQDKRIRELTETVCAISLQKLRCVPKFDDSWIDLNSDLPVTQLHPEKGVPHYFLQEPLDAWLKTKPICPVCRQPALISQMTRQMALSQVSTDHSVFAFKSLPPKFQCDRAICLAAVTNLADVFRYIPESLRNDRDFCFKALQKNSRIFVELPTIYQTDPAFLLKDYKKVSEALHRLSREFDYDEGAFDPWAGAETEYYRRFASLDADMRADPEVIRAAFKGTDTIASLIPPEGWNQETALMAVTYSSRNIQYVPEHLRSKEVCLKAIHRFSSDEFLRLIPKSLIDADREFCLLIFKERALREVSYNGLALEKVHFHLQNEPDICLAAVKQNWKAFKWVPKELRSWEIYHVALRQDLRAIRL